MGTINGVSGYNIGTDASVVVSDDAGDVFPISQLGRLMDFDSEADDTVIKITPIDNGGKPIFQTTWNGGHGRLMFTRANGNLQQMVMDLMAAYHDNGIIPQFSLSLNVQNRDGTVDEYLYTRRAVHQAQAGQFQSHERGGPGAGLCLVGLRRHRRWPAVPGRRVGARRLKANRNS